LGFVFNNKIYPNQILEILPSYCGADKSCGVLEGDFFSNVGKNNLTHRVSLKFLFESILQIRFNGAYQIAIAFWIKKTIDGSVKQKDYLLICFKLKKNKEKF
jgi:hypothetical protein